MLSVESLVKITIELVKNPKFIIYIPLVGGIIWTIHEINKIKLEQEKFKSGSYLNLSDSEEYKKLESDIIDSIYEKERMAVKLSEQCDKGSPGNCFTSLWDLDIKNDKVIATNLFVVGCSFSFDGRNYDCGKIIHEKYKTTLEFSKSFYDAYLLNSSSSCIFSDKTTLVNVRGSNIKEYNDMLNVDLDSINFCSFSQGAIVLGIRNKHNTIRIGDNENKGCNSSVCATETIELRGRLEKM